MTSLPFLQKLIKKFDEQEQQEQLKQQKQQKQRKKLKKTKKKPTIKKAKNKITLYPGHFSFKDESTDEELYFDLKSDDDSWINKFNNNTSESSFENNQSQAAISETFVCNENDLQIESTSPHPNQPNQNAQTETVKTESATVCDQTQTDNFSQNTHSHYSRVEGFTSNWGTFPANNRLNHNTRQSQALNIESASQKPANQVEERIQQIVESLSQLREDVEDILGPEDLTFLELESNIEEILVALQVEPPLMTDETLMRQLNIDCRYRFLVNYSFQKDSKLDKFARNLTFAKDIQNKSFEKAFEQTVNPELCDGLQKLGQVDVDLGNNFIEYFTWVLQVCRQVARENFNGVLYYSLEIMRRLLKSRN